MFLTWATSIAVPLVAARDGLTKLTPTIISGLGTAAIAVIGMLLKKPMNAAKAVGVVLVIAGVVVLNLVGGGHN